MAQDKKLQTNIDNSNPTAYPDAQIRDNDGSDNGTPVARVTMSDQFEFFAKLMRMAGLTFNNQYDNETNGYQYVQALIALAGKNDYVIPISSGTVTPGIGSPFQAILIPTDISILNVNEFLIVKATVDYAAETKIVKTGTNTPVKNVTSAAFKTGDYLLMVNGSGGVTISVLLTSDSANRVIGENGFLKAANNATAITGTSILAALTPASGLAAFINNVNGAGSNTYLATPSQNGLLSAADKTAIDNIAVKNKGWFSGLDPGASGQMGTSLPRSGDVVSAVVTSVEVDSSTVLVTVVNAVAGSSYFVRMSLESEGTLNNDNDCLCPIFKKVSSNSYRISVQNKTDSGGVGQAQSIKVHQEVVVTS